MHKIEVLAERYILLDSLLFKLVTIPVKETALLAIPETCADKIIMLLPFKSFCGHHGVIKTYLTITDIVFYTRPHALFAFLHKGLSDMPII